MRQKKILPYEKGKDLQALKNHFMKEFAFSEGEVQLFCSRLRAELTTTLFIHDEQEFYIEAKNYVPQIKKEEDQQSLQINLDNLVNKFIPEEDLIFELNEWAFSTEV